VITPDADHGDVDPLPVLARTVEGATGAAPAAVRLGPIQPGAALEVRFG
jgi:hypothetical protein